MSICSRMLREERLLCPQAKWSYETLNSTSLNELNCYSATQSDISTERNCW